MITVVIVNWNSGRQLERCLSSLESFSEKKVVVVDNASVDGSEQAALSRPGCKVIRSGGNLGFGRACNLGAKGADGDFLLFLNPDAVVYPGAIEVALDLMAMKESVNIGICGVQLVDETEGVSRSCARFPSVGKFCLHSLGVDRVFPRSGYFMSEWPHDESRVVDHVIGAFYMVRRDVFEALSGFDERFFVYFEDLDFSLRARKAGWRSFYISDARAFHAGGGTSRQVKAKRLFYSLRSRLLYAAKHFNILGVTAVSFFTLLVEPISRSVLAIARGSWAGLKETWQGYAMLWAWLPEWFARGVRG